MNIIKLAWRNIIDKPLNLVLSLILFALGIGLINFLMLLQTQLNEKFEANLADIDLVIGAKGSPLQMILCSMYHIDNPTGNINIGEAKAFLNPKHPLLQTAVPLSLGDNYHSFRIVGTNHEILNLYKANLGSGDLWKNDLEVVIGKQVSEEANLKIGDTFISSHGFNEDDDLAHQHSKFKVVGVLLPSGTVLDQLILTNTATIWSVHEHEEESISDHQDHHSDTLKASHLHDNSNEDLLTHPEEQITSLLIRYKNKTNFQALNLPRAINENTNMQAASPAYEINKLYSMVGVGTDAIRWIAILIGLVSLISIFISLYKSMKERKYELSLMRVLGGGRTTLFLLIILEGVFLSLLGWLIGMILSHGGLEIMAHYLKADFRYSFTGWRWIPEEGFLLIISIFVGCLAALIPAIQASQTDINKTLSSAGN